MIFLGVKKNFFYPDHEDPGSNQLKVQIRNTDTLLPVQDTYSMGLQIKETVKIKYNLQGRRMEEGITVREATTRTALLMQQVS